MQVNQGGQSWTLWTHFKRTIFTSHPDRPWIHVSRMPHYINEILGYRSSKDLGGLSGRFTPILVSSSFLFMLGLLPQIARIIPNIDENGFRTAEAGRLLQLEKQNYAFVSYSPAFSSTGMGFPGSSRPVHAAPRRHSARCLLWDPVRVLVDIRRRTSDWRHHQEQYRKFFTPLTWDPGTLQHFLISSAFANLLDISFICNILIFSRIAHIVASGFLSVQPMLYRCGIVPLATVRHLRARFPTKQPVLQHMVERDWISSCSEFYMGFGVISYLVVPFRSFLSIPHLFARFSTLSSCLVRYGRCGSPSKASVPPSYTRAVKTGGWR